MALLALRNRRLPNPQRLRVVALRRTPLTMILSAVFPLLFFVLLAAAIGNETIDSRQGVRLAQFLAPSMASFGAIVATFSFLAVGFAEARSAGVRAEPAYAARGPGRRAWSWVAPEERPAYLLGAASVLLGMWRTREQTKPYMFGHGYHFKGVKRPTTWCSVLIALDALGRYPKLWSGPTADPADRRSLAELMACLLEYNVAALGSSKGGTGTPRPPRTGR